MAKIMMRCPHDWEKEIFTGLDVSKKQGLLGLGSQMVFCSSCKQHHYLRKVYFFGDDPGNQYHEGLEVAPAIALEVGIIIGAVSFMESYIPQIFSKISGATSSHSVLTFGAFPSTSQKIAVLEVLRDLQPRKSENREDLEILIANLRKCSDIRNHYAHAKYSGGGSTDRITLLPYFGDSKKPKDAIVVSLDDVRSDAEIVHRYKFMIRDYLNSGVRPRR